MQILEKYLQKHGIVKSDLPKLTGDIPALTALRFFAAFYVSLFHVHYFSGYSFGAFDAIFASGYLAVDFFFVLSGFILAYTYADVFHAKSISVQKFMVKRLARIYPVHFVMLLVTAFFLWVAKNAGWEATDDSLNIWNFLDNALLVHAWNQTDGLTYNQPSWSISAEFFAYLCFPVLVWGAGRCRRTAATKLALSLFIFVLVQLVFLLQGVVLTNSSYDYGIIRIVPEFLFGISIYFFFLQYRYDKNTRTALFLTSFILAAFLYLGNFDMLIVPLFGAVIYFLADAQRNGACVWLAKPVWVYLGKISYSFYMVHYCVLLCVMYLLFEKNMGVFGDGTQLGDVQIACLLVTVIALFPAAMLLYHGVEVPMRRFIIRKFCK